MHQKQTLFSIAPQQKKVFRNGPQSVKRAYNASILPKRYIPGKALLPQRKDVNNSHYVAANEVNDWSSPKREMKNADDE